VKLPEPEPGLVVRYSYLWLDEARLGREDGSKDRPCAIVMAVRNEEGERRVVVLPVTHRGPRDKDQAIEIPAAVKRHLGLDDEASYVILTESNSFAWPGPDLRSAGGNNSFAYGFLPPNLFRSVREKFFELEARNRSTRVARTE
jgi:hypothetical protein